MTSASGPRPCSAEYPELSELLDPISRGEAVEGMEALAPVLVDDLQLVLAELPAGAHVILCDPERVRARSADLVSTSQEFLEASWAAAAGGGRAPIDLGAASLRDLDDARDVARELGLPWWGVGALTSDAPGSVASSFAAAPTYRGDTEAALTDLARWARDGWRVALVFDGHGSASRAAERLAAAEIPGAPRRSARGGARASSTSPPGGCSAGWCRTELKLALLSEADITGQRGSLTKDTSRLPSRRRNAIDPIQLKAGDFVVHEQHGVGRYVEMVRRTVNGGEREYLIIEYAPSKRGQPGDRLFVPTDSLDQVTKYVGGEAPSLSRLGGADWAKTKGRARKAVKEIAAELIRLYSARMATRGHAFGPDTPWQRELEDAFAYVETPDQLAAIDEVKGDMEKDMPMDRVICGDVGYGKTEVAVRAAFKAVQDGKQVAVLVPTTLLAHQHLQTFSERMAQFPVHDPRAVPLHPARRRGRDREGHRRRLDRHRHRHPPPAAADGALQGARPGHRRRGAALRRRAQGVPEDTAHRRRRAHHVGDADPAHAGDVADRHPRDDDDPDAAGGAAPDPDLRRRLRRPPGRAPRSAASCCARGRSSTSTTGSSRSTARPPGWPRSSRRPASPSRTGRCPSTRSSRS